MRTTIFPATFEQLDAIRAFAAAAAEEAGLGEKDVYAVQMAVDEAASNIVEHAYEGLPDGTIEASCEIAPDRLTLILRDHGKPFDPGQIPDPDLRADLTERGIGGLGLFLMRKMMDEVYFETAPDGVNVLTMIKRIGSQRHTLPRTARADWRGLLRLGEAMLEAASFAEQRDLILVTVRGLVEGEVSIWLDEALFRLPDWVEQPFFPAKPPDSLMRRARKQGRLVRTMRDGAALAVPIRDRETVLGVIEIRRPPGKALRKRERNLVEALAGHAAMALVAWHRMAVERFRLGQLSLFRTVSSQVANIFDLDELASRVSHLIQITFQYYYVAIFTLDPGQAMLRFRAGAGANVRRRGRGSPRLEVEVGQGLIGAVAESGEEILTNDVRREPRYRLLENLPETKSELTIPIRIENRVLGVLDVQSDRRGGFHPNDLLVLRALTDTIALAFEDARLFSALKRRADDLALVGEVGRAITSILDLREMMTRVMELLHARVGFPYVHLFTVHPNRRQIHYETGGGPKSHALDGYILDLDDPEGLIPWVARTGEVVLANDVGKEPHYRPSPFPPANTQSELCIPLMFNREVVGVLDVQSDQLNAFSDEDRLLFEALGESIASAIHNADLYRSEQWRRQVADSLREVAGLLSANASLEQVLDAILTELERNLASDVASIWLLGDDDIYCAAVHGARAADLETVKRNSQEARAWLTKALLARQPIIRRPSDPIGPSGVVGGFEADHSSIAAPLHIGDQAVGILSLAHHTPGRYGHEAQAMTATFASYAAVAIENARLYDAAQEQAYASAALLQVAQAVVSLSDLDEILATIVRTLPILVGVQRAALYRYAAETRTYLPTVQHGLPDEALPALWHPLRPEEFPLLAAATERGVPVLSSEAHRDPAEWPTLLVPSDEDMTHLIQSEDRMLMAFPLNIKDAAFGVLLTEEALGGRRFRNRRIEILTGVAQQAALAIQNDLFLQESRARERLETEVALARQIQQSFLQDSLPDYPGWDLATRWRTAREVGGDFFDVIARPDGRLGIFIADVADKGVPAALFMAVTRTLFRAAASETDSPAATLARVNRLMYPDTQQGMFVTAVYGVLDPNTGDLVFANAGHNPPLWLRAKKTERLTRTGMAMGVLEEAEMTERTIRLEPGDRLLLYTDGLTEAFSAKGEMYGEKRLRASAAASTGSAVELLEAVEGAVAQFIGSEPLADDLTLIAIKRLP